MGRRWVVDASNVMGSRPDGWWRDRPRALSRLVDEITRWRQAVGEPVVVVADGFPSPVVPEGELYDVAVRYAHSNARDAADDEIVRLVGGVGDPSSITVVTSDRRLRERVTALGTGVEGARTFLGRVADIEPRHLDRAVLARFGIDESALLGRGGEARVFALDDARVLRLPHPGVGPAALRERHCLLQAIATSDPRVAIPEILELTEVMGRPVVIERRLPGSNAVDVLGERGTNRHALVRDHLDVARWIADLPCPRERFGELAGPSAITASTFAAWSTGRLSASLGVAGEAFSAIDPREVTGELVAALPRPDPERPRLVHLDAFLGNMLAGGDRITALLDFGPMTIGGVSDLDPLVAIAYLAPEITSSATDADRAVADAWAQEAGLGNAVRPAERWIATYWLGAPDDVRLRRWCTRILLGG